MKKVNWDVVWSLSRTLLVAGGPVSVLLVALGFPPVEVGKWTGIGLAVVGVLSVAVPGIVGALKQTDVGKMAGAASVPEERKAAAVAQLPVESQASIASAVVTAMPAEVAARVAEALPSEIKIAAVTALPDVSKVVVKDNAGNGVGAALANPAEPKVVPESAT